MNKKQAVIIVVLLGLIVCAGVFATKLNGPLMVQNGEGEKSALSLNNDSQKASSTSSFFTEAKLAREHKNTQTFQNLKSIMEDKNISKEQRDKTAAKYEELSMASNHETKIELSLQAKGYEDVICLLNGDKATVTVKSNDKLTDKQLREIQNIVMAETKINNVEIQVKQ